MPAFCSPSTTPTIRCSARWSLGSLTRPQIFMISHSLGVLSLLIALAPIFQPTATTPPTANQTSASADWPHGLGPWDPCPDPYTAWLAGDNELVNCSAATTLSQTLCSEETVNWEVTAHSVVSLKTGRKNTECVTAPVPPRTKARYDYEFSFFYTQNAFTGVCKVQNQGPTGRRRYVESPVLVPDDCSS
jgi:hypothetical protein